MSNHQLPITDSASSVPVFDCRVIVCHDADSKVVRARVANLAGLEVVAPTERQALLEITKMFRSRVAEMHSQSQPIPWIDPPEQPHDGESMRWVPVHL